MKKKYKSNKINQSAFYYFSFILGQTPARRFLFLGEEYIETDSSSNSSPNVTEIE